MTIKESKQEAYESAIDSLARYKFMMFGYWAAIWVHLNNLDTDKQPNPFKSIVDLAKQTQKIDHNNIDNIQMSFKSIQEATQ